MPRDRAAYQKKYHEKWYSDPKNAEAKKANAKIHRQRSRDRNREFLRQYREAHPCINCGELHPACLDFHHRDPSKKTKEVSILAASGVSLKKIEAEIKKCDVLCRNCHAKEHYAERMGE